MLVTTTIESAIEEKRRRPTMGIPGLWAADCSFQKRVTGVFISTCDREVGKEGFIMARQREISC